MYLQKQLVLAATFLKHTQMAYPKPKRKKRKVRSKVRIKTNASMMKKGEARNDTLPKVQGRPPADVAPTFKVKIKKK